jgi:hypothetical protein
VDLASTVFFVLASLAIMHSWRDWHWLHHETLSSFLIQSFRSSSNLGSNLILMISRNFQFNFVSVTSFLCCLSPIGFEISIFSGAPCLVFSTRCSLTPLPFVPHFNVTLSCICFEAMWHFHCSGTFISLHFQSGTSMQSLNLDELN